MNIYALLSLDLERGVKEEQRNKFNDSLEKKGWKKIPDITTTWKKTFSDIATAESSTKKEVDDAATAAAIKSYHAAANFGIKDVIVFKKNP